MESSKIENTTIRQAFEQAQNYGMFEEKDGTQKFQRAILEQVILAEGKSEQDTKNWWVSVNPFFLGAHRDSVKVRERATEVSQANLIEADTTRERIDLSTTGIKHREEGGKHIYTLPSTMKDLQGVITGDIPVRVNNNGKFESQTEVSFDMPQAVNIALVTNQDKPEYIVSFSDAKKNMNTATVTTSSNVDSQPVETKIERNGISQQLAGSIYLMSRNSEKYPSFDKALLQIADQDYGGALKILKGYNANVARQLVALYKDKPEELATVLTYTYGSIRRIDNVNNFSQKKYRESHDVRVAAAENAIKGATPKNETTEKFFAEQATHQAKQLMDIFPSQPMAVSVYATPKGGTNRIDKYSGSVQVSNHTFEITDTSVKAIIFDRHKNENQKQLEVLNSRLSKDNPVNYTDFRDWLVNGKKPQQVE